MFLKDQTLGPFAQGLSTTFLAYPFWTNWLCFLVSVQANIIHSKSIMFRGHAGEIWTASHAYIFCFSRGVFNYAIDDSAWYLYVFQCLVNTKYFDWNTFEIFFSMLLLRVFFYRIPTRGLQTWWPRKQNTLSNLCWANTATQRVHIGLRFNAK